MPRQDVTLRLQLSIPRGGCVDVGIAETPASVDLNAFAVQISHESILILGTRRTRFTASLTTC